MTRRILLAIVLGVLFAIINPGCGGEPALKVDVPEKLTLYSIDGRQDGHETTPGPDSGKTFYGYPVLGRVVVEDPKRRGALIAAFNRGIAGGGEMAKCFWPRHALRLETRGQVTDYLICFECLQFASYSGGRTQGAAVDESPKPIFNEELKRAGIPLAPSSFKGKE